MNEWIEQLQALRCEHAEIMLVTIAAVRGSAPREVGARMIVTREQSTGSIGGGQLEYQCTRIAFDYLRSNCEKTRFSRRFPLGADLGQCCGGVVEVSFEKIVRNDCRWLDELSCLYATREPVIMATTSDNRYLVTATKVYAENESLIADEIVGTARTMLHGAGRAAGNLQQAGQTVLFEPLIDSSMNVAIFGAGHVGSACVAALTRLDCRIRWIDNRRDVFPDNLPARVTRVDSAEPAREVGTMPAAAFYLVMTHSHPLDYDICHEILRRDDFSYCGLIGSKSKRRRFENTMRDCDLPQPALDKLTCPIGLAGISGKRPEEIAAAVTAQLLQIRDAARLEQGYDHERPSLTVVARSDG